MTDPKTFLASTRTTERRLGGEAGKLFRRLIDFELRRTLASAKGFDEQLRCARYRAASFGFELVSAQRASREGKTLLAKRHKDTAGRRLHQATQAVAAAEAASRSAYQAQAVNRFLDGLDRMQAKLERVTKTLF